MALDDEILGQARQARDRLIAAQHEVDDARADYHNAVRRLHASGSSMREIADALGISHQRVHQIVDETAQQPGLGFMPHAPMIPGWRGRRGRGFTRFTSPARTVMVAAQDEARALGQSHVGTVHVLLGLLQADRGVAASALAAMGVEPDAVRALAPAGTESPSDQLPFSPEVKKTLELALREALTLKHDYIGTEHLLLALADDEVLRGLGVDGASVRAEVQRQLAA
jgi:hypothetical protein